MNHRALVGAVRLAVVSGNKRAGEIPLRRGDVMIRGRNGGEGASVARGKSSNAKCQAQARGSLTR